MSNQSNFIPSLLKVIGFMAFILLIINTVFSDNRITAGRHGRATIRGKQSATNPTQGRNQQPATRPAVKVTRVRSS
jgi:hypothetical protein